MTYPCKACIREERAEPTVAFYNAEGQYFCEEHKQEARDICRRASEIRSRRWSVRGADSGWSFGFGISLT